MTSARPRFVQFGRRRWSRAALIGDSCSLWIALGALDALGGQLWKRCINIIGLAHVECKWHWPKSVLAIGDWRQHVDERAPQALARSNAFAPYSSGPIVRVPSGAQALSCAEREQKESNAFAGPAEASVLDVLAGWGEHKFRLSSWSARRVGRRAHCCPMARNQFNSKPEGDMGPSLTGPESNKTMESNWASARAREREKARECV